MPHQRVLVIDDDVAVQKLLAVQLSELGYQVAVAADAVSAVGAVRREKPDVIVLDLGLPGGDGFLVIERLNRLGPTAGIPIIVLSGRPAAEYARRAADAGAACYLQKPPEIPAIVEAIRRACGEGPGRLVDWT